MAVYQRFRAWQLCHELSVAVYRATGSWPKAELFGLSSQARRAAHSAAVNIAEGCAKRGSREFRRYLDISLGSLSELSYTLLLAGEWSTLDSLHRNAGGMTWLLYKSMLGKKGSGAATT
jgi:four helix bundle protein